MQLTECQKRLVNDNWRLVPWVMQRKFKSSIRHHGDDLRSAGNSGLMKAAATFDAGRGKFSTWATRCIWSEMKRYVQSMGYRFRRKMLVSTALTENRVEASVSRELGPDHSELFRESDAKVEWAQAVKENRLTDWEVTLLTVRYVEGLSQKQTAVRMGLPLNQTVRLLKNIRERCHVRVRRAERAAAC